MPVPTSTASSSEGDLTLKESATNVIDEHRPVRLLSLDGGGIRGISSIIILKEVMRQFNIDRDPKQQLQPWQVFDLIGGTSTGGIIAIMLGCLRMTLDQCHDAYVQLSRTIFKPKRCKLDIWSRSVDFVSAKERYDSTKLEAVVKGIIREQKGNGNFPLQDLSEESVCRVFVTSVHAEENELVLLRSYRNAHEDDTLSGHFEMWEALRATSAASTYFKEFRHGNAGYVDGAFKSNNPIFQVEHEAKDLWPDREALIVSIGTGTKPLAPLRGHIIKLARTMTKLVTETEETWNRFRKGHKDMHTRNLLFRYSVPGIGGVDLGDYQQLDSVKSSTTRYLKDASTEKYVKSCSDKMWEIEVTDYSALTKAEAGQMILSNEMKGCMKALHRAAPDYESQRLAIEDAVPGTCKWFLEHDKFAEWLSNPSSSMLWVTANPGCGKTVLASYLTKSLNREGVEVCYFFFKAGEDTRQQGSQALCAILHQLYARNHDLVKSAMDQFSHKDAAAVTGDTEALWALITKGAAQLSDRKLICIIDALDECSESSRNRLSDLLSGTFGPSSSDTVPSNLKVLVTSRPWPSLESRLRPLLSIRLRGEDEASAMSGDIKKMIDYRVNELQQNSALSTEAGRLLAKKLADGADSTFLWAALVLDKVAAMPSRKLSSIKQSLEDLPLGLDELYENAFARFESRKDSVKLLETVLVARRALTIEEINIALNIGQESRSIEDLQREMEPDAEWTIKKLGGFFVRISQSTVSLVHETAREFLLRLSAAPESESSLLSISLQRANSQLAASCIRFLLLDGLPPRNEAIKQSQDEQHRANEVYLSGLPQYLRQFMQYASSHWFKHFEEEAQTEAGSALRPLGFKICDPRNQFFNRWWCFYAKFCRSFTVMTIVGILDGKDEPLSRVYGNRHYAHYASYQGDFAVVQGLVESGFCPIEEENDDELDVLFIASLQNHTHLVQWMLRRLGNSAREMTGNALLAAVFRHNMDNVRLLAESGIDVNKTYRAGRRKSNMTWNTPAALAAMPKVFGWAPVLTVLCQNGLIVTDEDIVRAASWGNYKALETFITHDMRPLVSRVPGLKKANLEATRKGWPKCRTLLRTTFASVFEEDADADMSIGLTSAAIRHDPDALEGILQLGAQDHGSALCLACGYANEDIVSNLLRSGAYTPAQLNAALLAFFESVNSDNLRDYQGRVVAKALAAGHSRLFRAFRYTSTFGATENGKYTVLRMLSQRGARVSGEMFAQAFAVVIPMDEDFAIFLIHHLHELQEDQSLNSTDFFAMACFWGRERIMRKLMDEGGAEVVRHVSSIGLTALQIATASGNLGAVKLLLDKDALPSAGLQEPSPLRTMPAHRAIAASLHVWWSQVVSFVGVSSTAEHPVILANRLGLQDIEHELAERSSGTAQIPETSDAV